jgi:hypothetical protein
MRRKLIVLAAAVASAGGATPAHTLGLACAENIWPAIGFLDLECTIGFGR